MKQIYNFEKYNPPILNENMIRTELEKRRLQKQAVIIAIAGILMQVAVLLVAGVLYEEFTMLAVACVGYVFVSILGSAVITVVCTKKRRLEFK